MKVFSILIIAATLMQSQLVRGQQGDTLLVEWQNEAEDGVLAGDAVIKKFEGFSYFQMDASGGFIQWSFDLPAAGVAELDVYTHLRGYEIRGQRIIINGKPTLRNDAGYGEYIWASSKGDPTSEWFVVSHITQAGCVEGTNAALNLPAGTSTIRIGSSWGYQNFSYVDVIVAGSTIHLAAPDADFDGIVTPCGEGAPWVPSGLNYVALNTSGAITWSINPFEDGYYSVEPFYQNYGNPQTGQILVDGVVVAPVEFTSIADSTGLSARALEFVMTAGPHTLTLSGSGVNIDFIHLIAGPVPSVSESDKVPHEYALAQNFPNPFNPTTSIRFSLAKSSEVNLAVYNLLGQKVTSLINGRLGAGSHAVQFDGRHLTSGIYFYRLNAGEVVLEKRMLLIK